MRKPLRRHIENLLYNGIQVKTHVCSLSCIVEADVFSQDKNRDHPHAERYFKVISEAYQVLSDPEARQLYDTYGKEAVHEGAGSTSRGSRPRHPGAAFHTHGFHGFHFQRPEDIFRSFFGNDPFVEDMFFGAPFGGFGGRAAHGGGRRQHRRDPFDDPFFSGGGSLMGRSMMMMDDDSFFSGFGGSGGGFSASSTSQSTTIRNGQRVTKKVSTRTLPNGTTERTTEEYVNGQCVSRETTQGRIEQGPSHGSRGFHLGW